MRVKAHLHMVAIPLNRVKVSMNAFSLQMLKAFRRNPLKSGQGFNPAGIDGDRIAGRRNPLKSGQGFNSKPEKEVKNPVSEPSQSP